MKIVGYICLAENYFLSYEDQFNGRETIPDSWRKNRTARKT